MTYLIIQICPDENCPGNHDFQNALKANSLQEAYEIKKSMENDNASMGSCIYCNSKLILTVAESG